MSRLCDERCHASDSAENRIEPAQVPALLAQLDGWQIDAEGIFKEYSFVDFGSAMRFVNAVAQLAEREGHQPDLEIVDHRVVVTYHSHEVGGLSRNDFICAAKTDALPTT